MTDAKEKSSVVVTVVRSGGNTASYLSVGTTAKPAPVERNVAVEQHEKLVAAAGD